MKKYCSLVLSMLLVFVVTGSCNVFAQDEDDIELTGVACQYSMSYIPTYLKTNQKYPSNTVTAINNSSVDQKQSITQSRIVTFTGNVGVKAERDIITGTAGISAEVGYGVSETKSHTVEVTVPAHTTIYVEIGSMKTTTSGNIKTINTDCSTTKSSTKRLEYTSGPYAIWYQ